MGNVVELRKSTREIRSDGAGVMRGHAALFDTPAQIGGYREIIRKGAFSRAIREGQDVRALLNHDANFVLGRTKSKTLTLREDTKGLFFECSLPDTQAGRDVKTLLQRRDLAQMSFAFTVVKERWSQDRSQRELLDLNLHDVSVCAYPAYAETSVAWEQNSARLSFAEYRSIRTRSRGEVNELEREKLRLQLRLLRQR